MLFAISDPEVAVSIAGIVGIEIVRNMSFTTVAFYLFDDSFISFGTKLGKVCGGRCLCSHGNDSGDKQCQSQ